MPAAAAARVLRQALAKLSLDALIQRDVPEQVRTSAFARSETLLQMSWVVGGAIGISLPLNGTLGMAVAAGLVALGVAAGRTGTAAARPGGAVRRSPPGGLSADGRRRHAAPRRGVSRDAPDSLPRMTAALISWGKGRRAAAAVGAVSLGSSSSPPATSRRRSRP